MSYLSSLFTSGIISELFLFSFWFVVVSVAYLCYKIGVVTNRLEEINNRLIDLELKK